MRDRSATQGTKLHLVVGRTRLAQTHMPAGQEHHRFLKFLTNHTQSLFLLLVDLIAYEVCFAGLDGFQRLFQGAFEVLALGEVQAVQGGLSGRDSGRKFEWA